MGSEVPLRNDLCALGLRETTSKTGAPHHHTHFLRFNPTILFCKNVFSFFLKIDFIFIKSDVQRGRAFI